MALFAVNIDGEVKRIEILIPHEFLDSLISSEGQRRDEMLGVPSGGSKVVFEATIEALIAKYNGLQMPSKVQTLITDMTTRMNQLKHW